MKKIFISGITGFIGSELSSFFNSKGYIVHEILRIDFKLSDIEFLEKISSANIIINLAGAPLDRRWTAKYKKEIFNSRILTTRKIADAINQMPVKPELFISTSAIGIYDDNKVNNEYSEVSPDDFLKKLCIAWEKEALIAKDYTTTVICRLGVVLDAHAGALKKLLPPFKAGFGAIIGSGQQSFSWIHIKDLCNAIHFIIENKLQGIYNLTTPNPINNKILSMTIGSILKRRIFLNLPEFFFKLIYGEGAVILIKGQYVIPKKLIENHFIFKYADIETCLKNLLLKK